VTTGEQPAVVRELRIAAPPDLVFRFLSEPEMIARWLGQSVIAEPRPGGVFRVDVNGADIVLGEFRELVPGRRVVVTWGWERGGAPIPPGGSTVEFTLTPDGEGTLLRLVHGDLPPEAEEAHAAGWDMMLPRLAQIAASA
jgi:uncharacterized protein YndB with AHSA1/START domain